MKKLLTNSYTKSIRYSLSYGRWMNQLNYRGLRRYPGLTLISEILELVVVSFPECKSDYESKSSIIFNLMLKNIIAVWITFPTLSCAIS